MKNDVLIKRYAEGLAGALRTDAEYETVSRELTEFSGLLETHELLRRILLRPFLASAKKLKIITEIVEAQTYQAKTRRLILLLVRHRRLGILPEIVRTLPALWKERRGIVSFEVRSVVPLKDGQRAQLEAELRAIEKRPVTCTYALDPVLIGGLVIRKGNMVYDVSLKGHLERWMDKIRER